MGELKQCPLRKGGDGNFLDCITRDCSWWIDELTTITAPVSGKVISKAVPGYCCIRDIGRLAK